MITNCGVDWSQVPARSHKPNYVGSNPTSATKLFTKPIQGVLDNFCYKKIKAD